jgi:hypothetical protein
MPVMWTGSHPRQRRRLAIRPTAPAPKDRMSSTKRCVFAGHRRMERAAMERKTTTEAPVIDGPSIRMAARTLGRRHGSDPCDGADETRRHMYGHNTEEYR